LREIALPQKIKSDAAKATYENGILKISVPKAEESKAKKIQVA
jgi:HSP20 family protein